MDGGLLLFVDLRKRFGADQVNEINETIMDWLLM
jgi:hypothetical protein